MNMRSETHSHDLHHQLEREAIAIAPKSTMTSTQSRPLIFRGFQGFAVALFLSVIWITLAASPGQAKGRIALLLGAQGYQNFKASEISTEQTEALGKALKKQGFEVAIVTNPVNAAARAALSEFSRKSVDADFALIVAAGHFATYRRQSFFLPVNVRVRRPTDLFSRGLSIASLADIAGRAKAGAVAVIATVPDIPSTVPGISARPDIAVQLPEHVTIVFSTSSKVPVSNVDKISSRAMAQMIQRARLQPLMLSALVSAASARGTGRIFGRVNELDLSVDLVETPRANTVPDTVAILEKEAERELKEARRVEELAKERQRSEALVSEAEQRARLAEERARAAEARAQRELAAAKAAQAAAIAARKEAPTPRPTTPEQTDLQSLQVVEALLGRSQRQTIQRLLRGKRLYNGPIDGIFGDRTRLAIKAFQRESGASETGYMTPEQFQKLVANR